MSHNYASSGSSSPDSSRDSDQRHDSDTTPSPSGGRSPTFDPQTVSTKLALYEASQSLSLAAETLAAASQAMSKAAASLALASGNFATEDTFQKPRVFEYHFETGESSPSPGSWSPPWQQTSYVFPTTNTTSENDPVDQGDGGAGPVQVVCGPSTGVASPLPNVHDFPSQHIPLVPSEVEAPVAAKSSNVPSTSQESPKAVEEQPATVQNGVGGTEALQTVAPEVKPKNLGSAPAINPSSSSNQNVKPPSAIPPPKPAINKPAVNPTPQTKSCIILQRPSDEMAAAAFLCRQHPKTICFYKYWDAAQCLIETFKVLASKTVIGTMSSSANKRANMVTQFLQGGASVLFWPGHIALPPGAKITPQSGLQVVHIGELSHPNNGINCTRNIVVTTNRAMSGMSAEQKNKFSKGYPVDALNDACNEQGKTSPVHKYRVTWQARLAKKSPTRALYTAFISYHHKHNPNWSAHELAKQANEYAREFLLRGEPKSADTVGGRIPLKPAEVKKWKLAPAVQSGAILVGA